ncbi:MAG: HDOD domain-containing protein [Gammaproteobacteria bacterium]|nr:HDOD domain-containing protein [Gammaproteobacteria bacterium]MBQ0841082.1 HDOD domain-containing protein [Gammaproteobacteria bacterium]
MTDANAIGFEFIQTLSDELSKGQVKLPAFPDVAIRIKSALEDPNMSTQQIAKLVVSDPVFSARLLKVANSAALNVSGNQIKDIPTAITRMGFKMAHSIAVSIAMDQVMNAPSNPALASQFQQLWQHSVTVAALCFVITKKQSRHPSLRQNRINPDEAMLAGLMHDIGKTYILTRAESYPALIDNPQALEQVMLDWHTGIGSAIIENWEFDEAMINVADEHELYDREPFIAGHVTDLTDVVLVANLMAHLIEEGDEGNEEEHLAEWLQIPAFERLGLDAGAISEIKDSSREEIDSIISALG